MSDQVPTTPEATPDATGADSAAATTQQGASGATDDTVTLSQEDYKNLIAARDRANNDKNDLTESVMSIQEQLEANAKRDAINEFLKDNKEKYPDLTSDDLASVSSPDDLAAHAERMQRRLEDVVQKRLLDVQKVDQPVVTPEERAEAEKRLKANPSKSSFQDMINLRST